MSLSILISEPRSFRIQEIGVSGSERALLFELQDIVGGYLAGVRFPNFHVYLQEEWEHQPFVPNPYAEAYLGPLGLDSAPGTVIMMGDSADRRGEASTPIQVIDDFARTVFATMHPGTPSAIGWESTVYTQRQMRLHRLMSLVAQARSKPVGSHGVIQVHPVLADVIDEMRADPTITIHDQL